MARLFVVIFACVAITNAIVLPGTSILQPTVLTKQIETIDVRPQYTFSYEVKDPNTGDYKNQIESRDGDVVRGSYSLLDADGLTRVVQYSSDGVNGFNAVVSRTPLTKQVLAAPASTLIKSVPILQQPTLIRSTNIVQAPSLIRSIPSVIHTQGLISGIPQLSLGGAVSSSSIVRAPPSVGLVSRAIPSVIQTQGLISGIPHLSLGGAVSSSSLVRAPPSVGLVSRLKTSSLLY